MKAVSFEENIIKEVKYDNLKELNMEKSDRSFKSFSFSVNYLDKDIIKLKSIWSLYSIVNKYKLSLAEWTSITDKSKRTSFHRASSNTLINGNSV